MPVSVSFQASFRERFVSQYKALKGIFLHSKDQNASDKIDDESSIELSTQNTFTETSSQPKAKEKGKKKKRKKKKKNELKIDDDNGKEESPKDV